MRNSHTSDPTGAIEVPAAPAGLNLLGDANAGGCCGGDACSLPG